MSQSGDSLTDGSEAFGLDHLAFEFLQVGNIIGYFDNMSHLAMAARQW